MINCSKSFSGVVTHAPWRKGPPQAPYQTAFSVRTAHRNPERDSHKHHTKRSSLFEQPVGARKGTATNTISSGVLCSNSSSEPGKDNHKHHAKRSSLFEQLVGARKGQPQTPYQAEFSVRIARWSSKRTATNTIPSGVLCSNSPSEPGTDSHKHHTKRSSLFERPIGARNGPLGTGSMARPAE